MKESRLIIRNKKKIKTEVEILKTKRACFGEEREKEKHALHQQKKDDDASKNKTKWYF